MRLASPEKWLSRLRIGAKLSVIPLVLVAVLAIVSVVSWLTIGTLSGLRAYVAGEGLYSKYQKDAVFHLQRFVRDGDPRAYDEFREAIRVPLGDARAREALQADPPDPAAAYDFFVQARNDPDDVPGMISLFLRFQHFPYIRRAIELWTEGDAAIAELVAIAENVRRARSDGESADALFAESSARIDEINSSLIDTENEFSAVLGEAFRLATRSLVAGLLVLDALLLLGGLWIASVVARSIRDEVTMLRNGVEQISGGDLGVRLETGSRDELGQLAEGINQMAAGLERRDEAIREHLSVLSATLESTVNGVLVTGADGSIRALNRRFLEMWNVPEGGLSVGDPAHALDRLFAEVRDPDAVRASALELSTTDSEREDLIELRDGRLLERFSRPQKAAAGGGGRVWSFRDVTEERRASRILHENQERLELAMRAAGLGAWELDFASGRVSASERTQELYGFDEGFDGSLETVLSRVHPEDRSPVEKWIERARKEARPEPVTFRVFPTTGGLRWLRANGRVFFEDGEPKRAVGIVFDVTEIQEAERRRLEMLVREQRAREDAESANRAKDEFLATLSHELRAPLSPILSQTYMLRRGALDPPATARALESIERSVRTQTRIIDDLLDVSRIVSGKLRLDVAPTDLAEVIENAIESVRPAADAREIRLQVILDPRSGPVSGDPDRLQQVVWNLLSNAVKFTPKGGRVQVRLARVDSHVELTVSDTGIGIRREFLPLVFERFRQADGSPSRGFGGLGLGLAIVRHLVELHGGTVSATSPGEHQGATFTVSLPLMPVSTGTLSEDRPRPDSPADLPSPAEPRLAGIRVLVVDDEEEGCEVLARVLSQAGAEVRTAPSAAAALGIFEEWTPDVLVSDIGMPGEDGYSLIYRVRALERERGLRVPAVALTAFARVEDRLRALAAGFEVHLAKPVELVAVVGRLAEPGRRTREASAPRKAASV